MPRQHGKDGTLLVDEFDFSGVVVAVDIRIGQNNAEATAFADLAMVKVEGQPGWTLDADGLWSSSSPAYDSEIFTDLTAVNRLLMYMPLGRTDGGRCFMARSQITNAPISSDTGSQVALDVSWLGNDDMPFGYVLDTETAEESSGNGTAYQVGAISSSQLGVGFLHVLSRSGSSPTLDVVIASDNAEGFSSATARISFTRATAATSQRVTVAGAVTDDWWRVQTTVGGSSPSFSFVCGFGIVTASG